MVKAFSNLNRRGILPAVSALWALVCLGAGLSVLSVANLRPIDFDTIGYFPVLLEGRLPLFWQHAGLGFAYSPYVWLHSLEVSPLHGLRVNYALAFIFNGAVYGALAYFLFRRAAPAFFAAGLYFIFPTNQFLLSSLEDNILVQSFVLVGLLLAAWMLKNSFRQNGRRQALCSAALGAITGISFLMATSTILWIPLFASLWSLTMYRARVSPARFLALASLGLAVAMLCFLAGGYAADFLTSSEPGSAISMQFSIMNQHLSSVNPAAFREADPFWSQLRTPGVRERYFLASTADGLFGYFQIVGKDLFREPKSAYLVTISFFVANAAASAFAVWNQIAKRNNRRAAFSVLIAFTLLYSYIFIFYYADRAYFERHDFYLLLFPFLARALYSRRHLTPRALLYLLVLVFVLTGFVYRMTSPDHPSLLYRLTAERGKAELYYTTEKELPGKQGLYTAQLAGYKHVIILKLDELPPLSIEEVKKWPQKSREALGRYKRGSARLSPGVARLLRPDKHH